MADISAVTQVFETATTRLWRDEDGIVHIVIKPGSQKTLHDVLEEFEHYPAITEGKRRPYLVDNRAIVSIDRDGREHIATEGAKYISAVAIVIDSHLSAVVGNFFMYISRPAYPTQLFSSMEAARAWLEQYRD